MLGMVRSWALVLLVGGVVWGEPGARAEKAGAPHLKLVGIYDSGDVQRALVMDGPHPYVVAPGQEFGPYQVGKLGDRQLTFSEPAGVYVLKMPTTRAAASAAAVGRSGASLPQQSSFRMELAGAGVSSALKLLCEGTDNNFVMAADTPEKPVTLEGSWTSDSAMARLAEQADVDWLVEGSVVLVGPAARLKDVAAAERADLAALAGAATAKCTVDFTFCDLRFFLDLIGVKEGGLKLDPAAHLGSVSCRMRQLPAAEMVAWALAVQAPCLAIKREGEAFTIR